MEASLDVGCGFRQLGEVNCDLYPSMVIKSRFVKCSIYFLPFRSGEFEKVFCHHVLEHLEEPIKALDEMLRVTKHLIDIRVPYRISHSTKAVKPSKHLQFFRGSYFKKYAQARNLECSGIVRLDPNREVKIWFIPFALEHHIIFGKREHKLFGLDDGVLYCV